MEQVVTAQTTTKNTSNSPLSVVWLMRESFQQFVRHFWYILKFGLAWTGIVLLAALPAIVGFTLYSLNNSLLIPAIILIVVGIIAVIWVSFIINAAYLFQIQSIVSDNPESFKELWALGKKHAIDLVAASLISGLIAAVGFFLLIIPGIIFSVWFAFVKPVVVNEGGSVDALKTSKALVKGRFWKLLGYFTLGTIVLLVYNGLATFIGGHIPGPTWLGGIIESLLNLPVTTLVTLFVFNLYHALKPTA